MLPMKIPLFFFEVWNEFFLPEATFRMGDGGSNQKNVSFFAPIHMYWKRGSDPSVKFSTLFLRVPLDSIRYDLMEIYCVLVSNFIFFEVY